MDYILETYKKEIFPKNQNQVEWNNARLNIIKSKEMKKPEVI